MPIVSRATPASGRKLHPQEELPGITNVAIKVDKLLEKQECLEGFQFGKGKVPRRPFGAEGRLQVKRLLAWPWEAALQNVKRHQH